MKWSCTFLLVAAILLSACSRDQAKLSRFRKEGAGPDEFSIVPAKPLETPKDMATLPPPTPGSGNRADQTPVVDAVVALGGKPSTQTEVPRSEAAVVTYAARGGIEKGIRQTLAHEDYETRRRYGARSLIRLGNNTYSMAYKSQWLDADRELQRLRAAKVKTPSAPPPAK